MTPTMTHLPHRGVIEIQGEDKATFLQGLISNDIQLVTPERTIYATLLNPQGRFLYDFFIMEKDGSYLLDVEAARLEALLKKLSLYKLRSKVTLTPRPDRQVFAVWGDSVAATLDLPVEAGAAHNGIFMDPRLVELGVRAMSKDSLKDFQATTPQDYDLHRLKLGVPEGGKDLIPERAILLESGLDELNAISWTKGCYMGQELTARTKYRGLVRKRIFPVIIEGKAPEIGTEVLLGGESVGEMRSHNTSNGLALLRVEAVKPQSEFVCGDALLKPYIPVWMRLEDPS
ncbi:MAG TPA: folate-binding protein [Alphaproteobacteria bacterium]|nr:folate-binding protein [Alphaproteobacteria bacterium]